MHSPTIRSAAIEDVETVLALWQAADAHSSVTDTVSALGRLVADRPGTLLVAELDGRVVGTIMAGWDGWRGTLYRLAVLPELRRRGIARALVDAALEHLGNLGAERISAFVVESDVPAVGFWNSLSDLGVVTDPNPKRRYVANLVDVSTEGDHERA